MRVLKHGGASPAAIQGARELACEHRAASAQPKSPPPAQNHQTTEFNALAGIDVTYLTGWNTNQKIPALHMIDYASTLQVLVPLFRKEASELIHNTFMEPACLF